MTRRCRHLCRQYSWQWEDFRQWTGRLSRHWSANRYCDHFANDYEVEVAAVGVRGVRLSVRSRAAMNEIVLLRQSGADRKCRRPNRRWMARRTKSRTKESTDSRIDVRHSGGDNSATEKRGLELKVKGESSHSK